MSAKACSSTLAPLIGSSMAEYAASMLTMVHQNPARVVSGRFRVDRKFHTGMLRYVSAIRAPLVTVHPEGRDGKDAIDTIEVSLDELPYGVVVIPTDSSLRPIARCRSLLEQQVAQSELVYGAGMGAMKMARKHRVPYVMIQECDLRTNVVRSRSQVSSPLRKLSRAVKETRTYICDTLPDVRRALSVHCNGYPIFDELRLVNGNRILYLDSRMSNDQLVPLDELERRLSSRPSRTLRMLYSGRYEPLKGALDVIKVGLASLDQGLDVELHCYGGGSQRHAMLTLAGRAAESGRIAIHDPIPYPQLVERSRSFDLFVCCHIQNDPSCTYLESFGAGLPIVGYGNRMWRRLCEVSGGGRWSQLGRPSDVVASIRSLLEDSRSLDTCSRKARNFAVAHNFDSEFQIRTDALNRILTGLREGRVRADSEN